MNDFQVGRLVRLLRSCQRPAHPAFMRIGIAVLVGDLADGDALHAHAQPRGIHHAEHAFHAGAGRPFLARLQGLGLWPQPPGDGVVEVQHTGRLALDAHLVLDAAGIHPVSGAHRAVFAYQEFGHHEEIHRGKVVMDLAVFVGDLGDHHVDDIAGQVLVAAGNENLCAAHAIGPVRLFDGAGLHQAQVGAAARFGQAHGAGPFARYHLWHDVLLHPVRRGVQDRAIGARRQHRIHGQRLVGAHAEFTDRHGDQGRHPRAARCLRRAQPAPAGFAVGAIRLLEALRRDYRAIFETAAFRVAGLVQRVQHLFTEFSRIGENVVGKLRRQVGKPRQVAMLFRFQDFTDQETVVVDGGAIDGHRGRS